MIGTKGRQIRHQLLVEGKTQVERKGKKIALRLLRRMVVLSCKTS